MSGISLGANQFTFSGDRTTITFFPVAPGPLPAQGSGPLLEYTGPEGNRTLRGSEVTVTDSPMGTIVSARLTLNVEVGCIGINVVIPPAIRVTLGHPVTFETVAIKTTSRGEIRTPGVEYTYTVLPLLGEAHEVLLPDSSVVVSAG